MHVRNAAVADGCVYVARKRENQSSKTPSSLGGIALIGSIVSFFLPLSLSFGIKS